MEKEKIKFDLDIFVKELSKFNMNFPTKENPSFRTRMYDVKSNLALIFSLADEVENHSIYWKAYLGSLNKEEFSELLHNRLMDGKFTFNSDESTEGWGVWAVVKKTFSKIHKSLRYIPLVSARDCHPESDHDSIIEFSYLYSEKNNLSFLLVYTNYKDETCLFPIKCFKKIKKNEIKQFQSLIFNYYDKYRDFYARIGQSGSCNRVLLNNNYKWDLKHVEKFFKKFMEYKEKDKKGDIDFYSEHEPSIVDSLAHYYNIYIFLVKEKEFYKDFSLRRNAGNEIKGMRPFPTKID